MTELVVAGGILVTVMTLVGSLTPKIMRLWKETSHRRAAILELSNEMERLTLLPPDSLGREQLSSLQPSPQAIAVLPNPTLTGRLLDDSLGRRLELQIDWPRRHPGKPIRLVGWLPSGPRQPTGDDGPRTPSADKTTEPAGTPAGIETPDGPADGNREAGS